MQKNLPKPDIFKEDLRINKVINHVRENYQRQIKESEVAGIAGLSEAAFSRFFKKSMGLCFTEYVNEVRVREASLLLSKTEDTVAGVAYSTGFNSPNYFNKIFKRSKGMTPGEYRVHIFGLLRSSQ